MRERGSADFFASEISEDVRIHGLYARSLLCPTGTIPRGVPARKDPCVDSERYVVANPSWLQHRRFLGLDPDVTFTALEQRDNRRRYPSRELHHRPAVGSARQAAHRLDRSTEPVPLARLPYPSGDEVTREKLADYYEDDGRTQEHRPATRELAGRAPCCMIE